MMFDCGLQNIFRLKNGHSRSINWENRNGEKGKGGMASSDLGPSRKGSPCIPKIEAGETVTLGEIQGEGMIQHIWITVTDRTSERNRYVLRDLVLRMYWDDEEFPSVECPLGDFFCCGCGGRKAEGDHVCLICADAINWRCRALKKSARHFC